MIINAKLTVEEKPQEEERDRDLRPAKFSSVQEEAALATQ